MSTEQHETDLNLGTSRERMFELSQLFPRVICDLIIPYDYHFEGILDWNISNDLIVRHVSGFEDGRVIASVGDEVTIWNGTTGSALWKAQPNGGVELIKVLGGMFMVLYNVQWATPREAVLFDSVTYKRLISFAAPSGIYEICQLDAKDDDTVRIVSFDRGEPYLDFLSYRRGGELVPQRFVLKEFEILFLAVMAHSKFVVVTKSVTSKNLIYGFQYVNNEISQLFCAGFPTQKEQAHLSFSRPTSDGGVLLGGSCYNLWEAHSSRAYLLFVTSTNVVQEILLDCAEITTAMLLPSQSRVLCATSSGLSIYDMATGKKQLTLRQFNLNRHGSGILPNEDVVVSDTCACRAKDLEAYDSNTGVKYRTVNVAEPRAFFRRVNKHASVSTCKFMLSDFVPDMTVLPGGRLACFGCGMAIYR